MSSSSEISANNGEQRFCICGKPTKILTSKMEKNPGRRFIVCKTSYGGCGHFQWIDGPKESNNLVQPLKRMDELEERNRTMLEKNITQMEMKIEEEFRNQKIWVISSTVLTIAVSLGIYWAGGKK